MAWDTAELKTRFSRAENYAITQYLERAHPSAHSDVSSELFRASKDIAESQWYSPNIQQYAYVMLHTPSAVIYALAAGMRDLLFRLPITQVPEALAAGGEVKTEIGGESRVARANARAGACAPTRDEWVKFNPFRTDATMAKNRAEMKRWCEIAYQYARTADAS